MKPIKPATKAENAISQAACDWIAHRDRGLSAEEADRFERWLAADARHRAWLEHHERHWQAFDTLAEKAPSSARPRPQRRSRIAWIGAAAGLAAAACLAVLWVVRSAPLTLEAQSYERRALPDGSFVELNAHTTLRVRFTAGERTVQLIRGEALFSVAKDAARPFVVRAGDVAVRAVGTAFNVRLAPSAVEVLVTEGRVSVAPSTAAAAADPRPPALVAAGERAVIARDDGQHAPQIAAIDNTERDRLLAWQPRLLDFSSTPLHEVVAVFNRHTAVPLVLGDPALRDLPIVATVRSDNLEAFLQILEITSDIRSERRADAIVLRKTK